MPPIVKRIETWIVFSLIALWSFVWDYNRLGDFQRNGKLKLLLLSGVLLVAIRVARTWHWTVAAAYLYLGASWLHFCFSDWIWVAGGKPYIFQTPGHEEMASITVLLFLCPLIAERMPRAIFEALTIVAASIHAAIGVVNLMGIYPFLPITQTIERDLPIGLLGHPTILGPFLAYGACLALLWAIDFRKAIFTPAVLKWQYAGLAAFLGGMAIATRSSMTYASLAAGLVVIALFYMGRRGALALAGTVMAALLIAHHFDHHTFHLSDRLIPWTDAEQLWKLRPWFGWGIGSWEPVAHIIKEVRSQNFPWTYLHSDPLQILFELGGVGAGFVCLVGFVLFLRIRAAYKSCEREALTWVCALAVFGTDSLANFALHLVPFGPIFMLAVYGLLQREGKR